MTGWRKQPIGDLPLYQAKTMSWLPRIVQGFTTRRGGVGAAPYDTLNLGAHVGDSPASMAANRARVWSDLGFAEGQIALAEQVHGDGVALVKAGTGQVPIPGVDALVTNVPDLLLMLFFADCVPVYLVDPSRKAIGLAHAGWRGTEANIAAKTVQTLSEEFGCLPASCVAAIGPSIGGDSYEVGPEVADRFRTQPGARAASVVMPRNEMTGTYTLNLRAVIFLQLLSAGLKAESIAVCDEDTFRNRRDFFFLSPGRGDGAHGSVFGDKGEKDAMKRLLIIVVVVLLGGALVFLNQGVRKSAMPDKDDDDQAQQSPASAAPKTPATPTDPKGVLPAEETVGNPAAPPSHRGRLGLQ